jgi:hypothetical protein
MKKCRQCFGDIFPENEVTVNGMEDMCYSCYKARKPNICIDFDGVLAQYSGWKGPDCLGDPMPGALDFVKRLKERFNVIILSTRNEECIKVWCDDHGFTEYIAYITDHKLPATVYVDDRAVQFSGNFTQTLVEVENFKPYWKEYWYEGVKK